MSASTLKWNLMTLSRRLANLNRTSPRIDDRGQGLTEYLILVFLIAIITLGTVKGIGSALNNKFSTVKRHINSKIVLEN